MFIHLAKENNFFCTAKEQNIFIFTKKLSKVLISFSSLCFFLRTFNVVSIDIKRSINSSLRDDDGKQNEVRSK